MKKMVLALALAIGLCLVLSGFAQAYTWIPNSTTNHSYALTSAYSNWDEAEAEAVSLGYHLVSIQNQAENDWLVSTFGSSSIYWIGFSDAAQEGNWVWSDGSPVTYTNWYPGMPDNNAPNGEDYAFINDWGVGKWNDVGVPQSIAKSGIIETPLPPSVLLLGSGLLGLGALGWRRRRQG